MFLRKEFIFFIIVNFAVVSSTIFILLLLGNGTNNEFPYDMFFPSLLIVILIIFAQYPLLNLKSNWLYRTFIFYISMVIFLFFFGMFMAWNQTVGSYEAGSWLARFDSGLRTAVFGQLFGGIVGIAPVIIMNVIFKDKIFLRK